MVIALANEPRAYGRWWHLAGAGTITVRQVAEEAFALVGRKPKMTVASKTTLRLIGLFNPFIREVAEMHYLVTDPTILDDSALLRVLGDVKKTPYGEGIRQCVEAVKKAA